MFFSKSVILVRAVMDLDTMLGTLAFTGSVNSGFTIIHTQVSNLPTINPGGCRESMQNSAQTWTCEAQCYPLANFIIILV